MSALADSGLIEAVRTISLRRVTVAALPTGVHRPFCSSRCSKHRSPGFQRRTGLSRLARKAVQGDTLALMAARRLRRKNSPDGGKRARRRSCGSGSGSPSRLPPGRLDRVAAVVRKQSAVAVAVRLKTMTLPSVSDRKAARRDRQSVRNISLDPDDKRPPMPGDQCPSQRRVTTKELHQVVVADQKGPPGGPRRPRRRQCWTPTAFDDARATWPRRAAALAVSGSPDTWRRRGSGRA